MLLEIILYFSLGFLAAILLVLLIAPTVWNRAVVLTKQKVESSLPLSLNEIQAEKDRLRAEHAMTTRRLELGIEDLRKTASNQVIELHSKRDQTNSLNAANKENLIKIEGLEKAAEAMRSRLEENQERIEALSGELRETSENLGSVKNSYDELRRQHSEIQEQFNRAKIELVASETRIESLNNTLATADLSDEERILKIQSLSDQNADLKRSIDEEQQKSKKSASELKAVSRKLQSAETKLEKRTENDKAPGKKEAALRAQISELTEQLNAGNGRIFDLEAKLTQYILREEAGNGKSQTDPSMKLDALKDENASLMEDIKSAAKSNNLADKQNPETQELKERIRDLAAKTIIASGNSDLSNIPDEVRGSSDHTSLADRVKALQNSDQGPS